MGAAILVSSANWIGFRLDLLALRARLTTVTIRKCGFLSRGYGVRKLRRYHFRSVADSLNIYVGQKGVSCDFRNNFKHLATMISCSKRADLLSIVTWKRSLFRGSKITIQLFLKPSYALALVPSDAASRGSLFEHWCA